MNGVLKFWGCVVVWLVLGGVVVRPAWGGGWGDLYGREALGAEQERYVRRTEELYGRVRGFLSPREKAALSGLKIQVPLLGVHENPFDFYSYRDGQTPTVVLPVVSLKFVEDLSVVYAWLYKKNKSLEAIDRYVAMLRYKPVTQFPGGRYPDPFEALGVPRDAWQEPAVSGLYLSLRNEAWAFILLHELGHLVHQHPGNQEVAPGESRRHEEEADRFALEVLRRTETIPMGMVLWFQATAPWFPNRADYQDDRAFEEAAVESMTHPTSPRRLLAIAKHMRGWPSAKMDAGQAAAVTYISERLEFIAQMLADPDMQRAVAEMARRQPVKSLKQNP